MVKQLPFEILTNDKLEAARTGNWFAENSLVICRLDKLSRNEDVQAKLEPTDWDLIVRTGSAGIPEIGGVDLAYNTLE